MVALAVTKLELMGTANLNPKVAAYVAKAPPSAQPILTRLRELVHRGCPGVEETMKWSRPFFEYHGVILCYMAAFKEHCRFGFWGEEIGAVLREAKAVQGNGMGSLGRITSVKDLPSDKLMLGWIRKAAAFVDSGQYTSPISARRKAVKAPSPAAPPAEFTTALRKNRKAASVFAALSPSCKREYIEWISEAKRPATRDKRIATAVEWIAEGKQRNWKYL
jgi:uncharacterized protein YdeI (YjbR/CyaY-like superfamily)